MGLVSPQAVRQIKYGDKLTDDVSRLFVTLLIIVWSSNPADHPGRRSRETEARDQARHADSG
jgi:hypothetical protein